MFSLFRVKTEISIMRPIDKLILKISVIGCGCALIFAVILTFEGCQTASMPPGADADTLAYVMKSDSAIDTESSPDPEQQSYFRITYPEFVDTGEPAVDSIHNAFIRWA